MSTDPPGRKPEPPAEDDDATRVIVPGSPADGPSKEDYRRTVMGTGPGDPFGTAVPTGRPSDDGADPRGLHEDDEAHHEPIDDSATAVSAPQPDPQVVTASPVGTVLNENYKIERLIGAGGMGEVYEGEHLFTGNRVAIKMILEQLSKDETIVSLFRREARILFELADDAIVRYLDSFYHSASGRYCLVTQFIEGTPLSDHLTRYGALDEARGRLLMARLARGLQKAHDRGVVHRDLSPDNVMLRDGKVERAALIDFGIATAEDMGDATLFGKFAGKFRYVSPEQLGLFGGKVGPHTDIYGLALLMAAALRGTALDMGQSVAEAVDARRSVPALDGIPASLAPVLTQMLAPDPAHRPVSMDEVLTLLEVTSGGNEETVIQTPGTRPPSVPPAPQVTQPTAAPVTGRLALPPGASQPPAGSAPPTMPTGGLGHAPLGAPVDPTSPGAAPFAATTAAPAEPEPRKGVVPVLPVVAAAVVAAMAGGGIWWSMTRSEPEIPDIPVATEETSTQSLPPPNTETRDGFLAAYASDFDCAYAARITSGAQAGRLVTMGDRETPLPDLAEAYGSEFGVALTKLDRPVTSQQCPALDLARGLQGREAVQPTLVLDSDTIGSGGTVVGRVAEIRGRTVWLAMVTAEGGVYDLSDRLEPQTDGSALFAFELVADPSAIGQPQILVALASPEPLVGAATASDGTSADVLLPNILAEASEKGAAAEIARFELGG